MLTICHSGILDDLCLLIWNNIIDILFVKSALLLVSSREMEYIPSLWSVPVKSWCVRQLTGWIQMAKKIELGPARCALSRKPLWLGLCLISRAARISAKAGPKQHSLSMYIKQSLWFSQNYVTVIRFNQCGI